MVAYAFLCASTTVLQQLHKPNNNTTITKPALLLCLSSRCCFAHAIKLEEAMVGWGGVGGKTGNGLGYLYVGSSGEINVPLSHCNWCLWELNSPPPLSLSPCVEHEVSEVWGARWWSQFLGVNWGKGGEGKGREGSNEDKEEEEGNTTALNCSQAQVGTP